MDPFPTFITVRDLQEWLLTFDDLKLRCSDEFRLRLEQALASAPGPIDRSFEAYLPPREIRCLSQPPEPQIHGLLTDILLSLYGKGESLTEICALPHLRLLEITPQEIAAEHELRKAEMEKGHKCRYCQEYLLTDDEECRFCEGSANKAPVHIDLYFDKPPDLSLLRAVIMYEAEWRRLNDADAVSEEILAASSCSKEEIEQEILRQETGQLDLPRTSFCKRMMELQLVNLNTPEQLSLDALSGLARALDTNKTDRADEALIVLEHALRRTEGNDDVIHQKGTVLSTLSLVYLRKKDDAKYKLYKKMSDECSSFGMDDEMKSLMDETNESLANMFKDENAFEEDPEKRLASFDAEFSKPKGLMGKMVGKVVKSIPGIGEMFASLESSMEDTKKTTRLILEAQVAQKNGDLEQAESKYTEALSITKEDRITGMSTKISVLCSLSELQHLRGNDDAAEATVKEAVRCGTEIAEAHSTLGKTSLWPALVAYGCFLRDTGKYDESEQNFQQALIVQDECAASFIEKYGGDRADYCKEEMEIKGKYAQLLRAAKREEEAVKFEAEVVELKKKAEVRAAELKERRDKMNPPK